jgi:hypothetical protein
MKRLGIPISDDTIPRQLKRQVTDAIRAACGGTSGIIVSRAMRDDRVVAFGRSFFLIAMKLTRLAATFGKLRPLASALTNSKAISIRNSAR